jgi:protein phosphatase
MITRALGSRASVKVDAQQLHLEEGDLLLLCSDGLHGMLDDATIANAAMLHEDLDAACELLISLANEAGGADNVSVVLVRAIGEIAEANVVLCGACGARVIEGNLFCNECGARVG